MAGTQSHVRDIDNVAGRCWRQADGGKGEQKVGKVEGGRIGCDVRLIPSQ